MNTPKDQPQGKNTDEASRKIRLDDLLPMKNVKGGNAPAKVVFGLTSKKRNRHSDY